MAWPLASALLGIAAFYPGFWILGLLFTAPLFIFLHNEKRLGRLLAGALVFRLVFISGAAYFAFEPLIWLGTLTIFLGLPLSFFLVRRRLGATLAFWSLPVLWTIWDLLAARYTLLPTYVITAGNALGGSPFMGLARFGGMVGLTFFAAAIGAIIAYAIAAARARERLKYLIAAGALVAGGGLVSQRALQAAAAVYDGRSGELRVAAVSTDSPGLDAAFRDLPDVIAAGERPAVAMRLGDALGALAKKLRGAKPDLVALPEDMIDLESWGDADAEALNKFGIESGGVLIQAYRSLARELDANLTATFTTLQGGRRYNTTLLFNRRGEIAGRYNKARLAIGGEYWPFGEWRPFYWNLIARLRPEVTNYSPLFDSSYQYSSGQPTTLQAEGFSFGSPICIEAHYPEILDDFKSRGADFLIHTSNNRWVSIGLAQYLRLTDNIRRIEAVRLGLPIIITGRGESSGVVRPDGLLETLPQEGHGQPHDIFWAMLRL